MHLRVTIDDQFTITAAMADYDAAPYNQECTAIAPDYRALVGMNLLRNFRQAVKDRFGRTAGCTRSEEHTSELQSLMRISYAVFCLKQKKKPKKTAHKQTIIHVNYIINQLPSLAKTQHHH